MSGEEAIEKLNRFKTIKVLYGNTLAMPLEDLEKLQLEIDIVLNLTKEQQLELEKKDNVIDEMVNLIYEMATGTPGTTFHYLKKYGFDDNECSEEKCKSKNCKICIKQHFERKLNNSEQLG